MISLRSHVLNLLPARTCLLLVSVRVPGRLSVCMCIMSDF